MEAVVENLSIKISAAAPRVVPTLTNVRQALEGIKEIADKLSPVDQAVTDSISKAAEAISSLATAAGSKKFSDALANMRELSTISFGEVGAAASTPTTMSAIQTAASSYTSAFQEVANTQIEVKSRTVEATNAAADLRREFQAINNTSKQASAANNEVAQSLNRVSTAAKGSTSRIRDFVSSVMRIAKYRFIRSIIRSITDAFREGVQHMYEYSKVAGTSFAPAMDSIATSSRYFKNAIGALVAPLIEALAPALEKVVDYLVGFLNALNQIISALTGKTTWTRAVKVPQNYTGAAKAATKATKELRNAILDIDELHVIDPLKTGGIGAGGSGAIAFSEMFEELPIEQKFIELAELLEKIWEIAKWIGVAFLGWKIASGVVSALQIIGGLFGLNMTGGGGLSFKNILGAIGGLVGVIVAIGGVVVAFGALSTIDGFDELVEGGLEVLEKIFKGIGAIFFELVGVSALAVGLGYAKFTRVVQGVGGLATVITALTGVVVGFGALATIEGFKGFVNDGLGIITTVFQGLSDIFGELIVLSALTVGLGFATLSKVAQGILGLSLVIGVIPGVVSAVGGIMSIKINDFTIQDFVKTGVNTIVAAFDGVWKVADKIAAFAAGAVLLGMAEVSTILTGLAGLTLVILALEVILAAIGGLTNIPGWSKHTAKGAEEIGNVIGKIAATIVDNITGSIANQLPKIGSKLTEFANNAKGFFDMIKGLTQEHVEGLQRTYGIAEGMWVVSQFRVGGLKKLGENLWEFGAYFKGFADYIKDINIGAVQAANETAQALAGLLRVQLSKKTGEDLVAWSATLPAFGKNIKLYGDNISGLKVQAITESGSAVNIVIALSKKVPSGGGLLQDLLGTPDISNWAKKLPPFASAMVDYSNKIANMNVGAVNATSTAINTVIEFARKIPLSGGLFERMAGTRDVEIWSAKLPAFADYMVTYSNKISGLKTDVIDKTSNAIKSVIEFTTLIPNTGGLFQLFTGEKNFVGWASKLVEFGNRFNVFYTKIKDMSMSTVSNFTTGVGNLVTFADRIKTNKSADAMIEFAKAVKRLAESILLLPASRTFALDVIYNAFVSADKKKLYKALELPGWPTMKWKMYASGGLPPVGELFMAREAGPELVGSIGRKTAVASNDQIIEGITQGVMEGMLTASAITRDGGSGSGDVLLIQIGDEVIYNASVKEAKRQAQRSGRAVTVVG